MEPEPIFYLAGAESRSGFFKAAPAASFWQKKGKPCVVTKLDLTQLTVNVIQKILALIIHFLRSQNENC